MQNHKSIQLNCGVFTISLDFELIWGALDLYGPGKFRHACEIERFEIIDRLLQLFVEFNISATWFVVGHLFLTSCEKVNGRKHPEIMRSDSGVDWFQHDPSTNEENAPLFYGRSLIEKIRDCSVFQEIGLHSFSHVIFDEVSCSRETAESELVAGLHAAQELGIQPRSFAFPRNVVGHLEALSKYGFVCYRGVESYWYQKGNWPVWIKRSAHFFDVLRAAKPSVVLPEQTVDGLLNIPGSMIYFPKHGIRQYIPMVLRVNRAIKGLEAAVREWKIFHLWFHPSILAYDKEKMFSGLRKILDHASSLRDSGKLMIMPMEEISQRCFSCIKPNMNYLQLVD